MRGMNIGTFPRYSTFIDNVQTFFCGFMFSRDGHTQKIVFNEVHSQKMYRQTHVKNADEGTFY